MHATGFRLVESRRGAHKNWQTCVGRLDFDAPLSAIFPATQTERITMKKLVAVAAIDDIARMVNPVSAVVLLLTSTQYDMYPFRRRPRPFPVNARKWSVKVFPR